MGCLYVIFVAWWYYPLKCILKLFVIPFKLLQYVLWLAAVFAAIVLFPFSVLFNVINEKRKQSE